MKYGYSYQYCYCEENIYKLLAKLPIEECSVLVITNNERCVLLWQQEKKASKRIDYMVFDYHVILVRTNKQGLFVYDFDSKLSFPIDFNTYVTETFEKVLDYPKKYYPLFRVFDGREYHNHFSSDRSHMIKDGKWTVAPPSCPAIQRADKPMTLKEILDIKRGYVGLEKLKKFFRKKSK